MADQPTNAKPFSSSTPLTAEQLWVQQDQAAVAAANNAEAAKWAAINTAQSSQSALPAPIPYGDISALVSSDTSISVGNNSSVMTDLNTISVTAGLPTNLLPYQYSMPPLNSLNNSPTPTNANLNTSVNSSTKLADPTTQTEKSITDYMSNLAYNLLDSVEQPTYHLKFFLVKSELIKNQPVGVSDMVTKNPNIFSDDNITIIAESGVNIGLYVSKFTIHSIMSLDPAANSSGVGASLVLREPLGANFIDYFNGALYELGYETRVQVPIFLEISFRGYDTTGNIITSDSIGTKLYRFIMTDINASFRSSETQYDISLITVSDVARQIANSSIDNSITIHGKTVKDFYDQLMVLWNKPDKSIEQNETQPSASTTGATGATPSAQKPTATLPATETKQNPAPVEKNIFSFRVDDLAVEYKDCLSWEVGKSSDPDRLRTANGNFETKEKEIQATFGAGSSKMSIMLDILMSTKNYQSLVVNGKKQDQVDPSSKAIDAISYVGEIDSQVELAEYNPSTHTYNKKIIFIIQERETTRVYPTQKHVTDAASDIKALETRLKYVRRRYDYFGTGKNTEILDLNISLSTNLLISLPAYSSQKRTAVADNPKISTTDLTGKQVADSKSVKSSEGVKAPTPTNPDVNPKSSNDTVGTVSGTSTTTTPDPASTVAPGSLSTSGNTFLYQGQQVSADYLNSVDSISQYNLDVANMSTAYLTMTPDEKKATLDSFSARRNLLDQTALNSANALVASQANAYADATASANAQIAAALGGPTTPLDSVAASSNQNISVSISGSSPTSGTRAYGANTNYLNANLSNPASRGSVAVASTKNFLEDFDRDRFDSPKGDVAAISNPSFAATTINNSGGYNIDDSSGIGKSFVSALLGQIYGNAADMTKIQMSVRGDPLWLGATNKAKTDQMGSLIVGDGKVQDYSILLVVTFPTQYSDNTGLAIPNKVSEGYTAIYNVIEVESEFENGKFTQVLNLTQDLTTQQVRKYLDPKGGSNV